MDQIKLQKYPHMFFYILKRIDKNSNFLMYYQIHIFLGPRVNFVYLI